MIGEEQGEAQDQLHQPTPERRLDRDIAAEGQQQRGPDRHHLEVQRDHQHDQQDAGADGGPELHEAAVRCSSGGCGRWSWRRWARGSPGSPASARASAAWAASSSSDSVASRARNAASSYSATRRASSSLVGPVSASVSAFADGDGRGAAAERRRPWRRPGRRVGGALRIRGRDAIAAGPPARGAAAAALSRPRKPSGSFHDWRAVAVRVYLGPAGARSPAKRSLVSRPHSPRKPSIQPVVSSTTIGVQLDVAARSDGQPVAARVVDERDGQGRLDAWPRGRRGRPGAGRRARTGAAPRGAPRTGRRAGSGTGVTYSPCSKYEACEPAPAKMTGWPSGERQGRVVPAAPQVVARVVVRRAAEPARDGRRRRPAVLEDDERLLEVGLVVVRAEERRAPVVHAVDEQVVEDDPAVLPHDPAVVDDPLVVLADRRVAWAAAAAVPPGTLPRTSSEPLNPASTRRANRPTRARRPGARKSADRAAGSSAPATADPSARGTNRRNRSSPGTGRSAARRSRVSSPAGDDDVRPFARRPTAAGRRRATYVLRGHREEVLALREADDRLDGVGAASGRPSRTARRSAR